MPKEIVPGAQVGHEGLILGAVEEVVADKETGDLVAILVRHGRANYLLRVPASYVIVESPWCVELDTSLDLDDLEKTAIESGRMPPVGTHITDAGPTEPTPVPEEVMGQTAGLPSSYDAPATG